MQELERLLLMMKSLRDPETGCPWDKEQTINSIRGFTLEEVYELVDAIERNDMEGMRDELGDLLFHIIFYAEMSDEQGNFNFRDVVEQVNQKLERRHPHVFAGERVESVSQVKELWEKIKSQERKASKGKENRAQDHLLDDISKHMPAVQRALKLQKRAAGVGFDWPESAEILNKIEEEIHELGEAISASKNIDHISEELGDLMFCCINLARHYSVDPELALRRTNDKFVTRFSYIETVLKKQNKSFDDVSLQEMDALWNEAKQKLI